MAHCWLIRPDAQHIHHVVKVPKILERFFFTADVTGLFLAGSYSEHDQNARPACGGNSHPYRATGLTINFFANVMSVAPPQTGAGDKSRPVSRVVRTSDRGGRDGQGRSTAMGNWVVWLAAFLGFAAVLAVGVVLIAVDILRAHAEGRDSKRLLQQSIIKPSVLLPSLRPRSTVVMVVERVAFALFIVSPVLVLGAAAVLAVMHLAAQNPG
jgi:hypothetical protein